MQPLHHAAANQAGQEVVAALLLAHPHTGTAPDKVRCGADVRRCVFSEYYCATKWFICVRVCVVRTT